MCVNEVNYKILSVVSESIVDDLEKSEMLARVKKNGNALKYETDELQSDRENVLEAVKTNGMALEYASNELKGDREIVLEAVKQNGLALKYASPALRDGVLEDYIKKQLFLSTILFGAKAFPQQGLVPDSNCVLDKLPGDLGVTRLIAQFLDPDYDWVLRKLPGDLDVTRLIAQFAGVPVGKRLGLIQGAAENL